MSEKGAGWEKYYLDDNHNIVDPDKATKVVINEFDENGVMIRETWGFENQVLRKADQKKQKSSGWLKRLFFRIGLFQAERDRLAAEASEKLFRMKKDSNKWLAVAEENIKGLDPDSRRYKAIEKAAENLRMLLQADASYEDLDSGTLVLFKALISRDDDRPQQDGNVSFR